MRTTSQLLEEAVSNLPTHGQNATHYRLAQLIGISDQYMYRLRHKQVVWSDELIDKTSPFLKYPPEVVKLWARMEREKNPQVLALMERLEEHLAA